MQRNNFKLLTTKEIESLNRVIRRKFGPKDSIASGSCETDAEGKKRYHIVLQDPNAYKSTEMLKGIGSYVQNILDAEEVYHLGIKIA